MKIYIIFGVLVSMLFACGSAPSNDTHAAHDHDHDRGDVATHKEALEQEIILPEAQAQKLGLEYETVKKTTFSGAIRVAGVIEPSADDRSTVVAATAGVVHFSGNPFNIGTFVRRGATLMTISSDELTDGNMTKRLGDAQAELLRAEAEYSRLEKLLSDKLATVAEVENARAALSLARSNVKVLTPNGSGRSVTAPESGYVSSIDVQNGQYVEQGARLMSLSSGRELVVRGSLSSRHFDKLSQISTANFTTTSSPTLYTAKLLSRGNGVGDASRSVPVRFSLANRAELVAGQPVELFILTTARQGVITAPLTALTQELGGHWAYVRVDNEGYYKRFVELGQSDGERVEILSGLQPGDNLVTRGAYFVHMASMSSAIPSGHSH
ncbi:MAG: efflux RND transporter periplasmic adaptor subunit [Mucinivorans sp.]